MTPWPRIDPEPLRTEVDGARWYRHPDTSTLVPSVTTVLAATDGRRFALERWRQDLGAKNAQAVTDIAVARGERLHADIERFLRDGTEPGRTTVWWWSVELVVRQMASVGTVLLAEGAVFDPLLGYAGTVDMVVSLAGRLYVVDWQTAAEVHPPERLARKGEQVAAYAGAIRSQYGEEPDGGLVVTALPDRRAHVHRVALGDDSRAFCDRLLAFHG